ncbi:MAG TPA: hypothetical protein PLN85_01665 [archaeon]|nr:hypothetical protein [archaeon]HRS54150.1 hypothetical protein [Bacteroidales bacterium]
MIYEIDYFDNYSLQDELKLYKEMKDNDPIVNTSIEVLKTPLNSLRFDVLSDNKELIDYIYSILEDINFNLFIKNYFYMLDYGFVIFEKAYKYDYKNNGYKLSKLQAIKSSLFYNLEYINEKDYRIILKGYDYKKRLKEVVINADDCFIANYNLEFSEKLGQSLLKPIRVYYILKKNLLKADSRLRLRGAGTVLGGLSSDLFANNEIRNSFENMLANIGNNKNGYGVYILDKSKIDFVALTQNNNNIEMIRYYDHCIFYNTTTQFLFAGIDNQNGGRANTREHRLVYINKINSLLAQFENDINNIFKKALSLSKFANEEFFIQIYRIAELEATEVATEVAKLGNIIKLKPEDEAWFRQAFGLPEIDINEIKENNKNNENNVNNEIFENKKHVCNCNNINLSLLNKTELSKKAQNIFELEAIKNNIIKYEDLTEFYIKQWFLEQLKKIGNKLNNKNINLESIKITQNDLNEIKNKIYKIYKESVNVGRLLMEKEINKVLDKEDNNKSFKLMFDDIDDKDIVGLYIEKYADTNIYSIKQDLINLTNIDDYESYLIDKYKDNNKKLLTDIKMLVANGLIDGRGEVIEKYSDIIKYYEYSAVLDDNICNQCEPLDGLRKTIEEWTNLGINLFSPVNPNCEGGNKCRCVLIPIA